MKQVRTFLSLAALLCVTAGAQITVDSVRQTSYDFACLDGAGNVLSGHQRQDKAIAACATRKANDPDGTYDVQGGRWRIGVTGVAEAAIVVTVPQVASFSVSDITFIDGGGDQTHDLNQYYAGAIPVGESVANISLSSSSAALPAGISIDIVNEQLVFDDSVATTGTVPGVQLEVVTFDFAADFSARSGDSGVFYANNFDYANRTAYLADAHSYTNESSGGEDTLDLDTSLKLTGNGASRHNWLVSDGANEAGPNWRFSFDGLGETTTNTKKTEFYFQYSMLADEDWAAREYSEGSIKTMIIFNPDTAPFDNGEIVMLRRGEGPWPHAFRYVNGNGTKTFELTWDGLGMGLDGDDTWYTFWDDGAKSEGGETDETDVDLFEQRWGVRRRNADPDDADYDDIPKIEPNKWYTFEAYINVDSPNSIMKVWFAERGKPPILLQGSMAMQVTETTNTYRGAEILSRAEYGATPPSHWITDDAYLIFDEVIVSDDAIEFPGGYQLPYPGTEVPAGYPPSNATPRTY